VATWEVSPILVPLITEVKTHNPGMTVFTIGDTAHQQEESDHNPDEWEFVCAGDFMIGDAFTVTEAEFLFSRIVIMIRAGDKRCAYAIWDKHIVSSTVSPGVVRAYTGDDPHTNHVHVSVPHGSQPHPTTSWKVYVVAHDPLDSTDLNNIDSHIAADANATPASGTLSFALRGKPWQYPSGILNSANSMLADISATITSVRDISIALSTVVADVATIKAIILDLQADSQGGDPSTVQEQIADAVWKNPTRTLS